MFWIVLIDFIILIAWFLECTFMDKVIRYQNYGAVGVIIVNVIDEDIFMMGLLFIFIF